MFDLIFSERLTGELTIPVKESTGRKKFILEFKVGCNLSSEKNPSFEIISGVLHCLYLSKDPINLGAGSIRFFANPAFADEASDFSFEFALKNIECGHRVALRGRKILNGHFFHMLKELTSVQIEIVFENRKYRGEARVSLIDFISISIFGISRGRTLGLSEFLKSGARLSGVFLSKVLKIYSVKLSNRFSFSVSKTAELFMAPEGNYDSIITRDHFKIGMTKITPKISNGNAVLLVHGFTNNSKMFTLAKDHSPVACFLEAGFTIYLADTRFSCAFKYNTQSSGWNLEDSALYDYPAILSLMREKYFETKIWIFAHCVGSMTVSMAMIRGLLGKIEGIISNSVSLKPTAGIASKAKMSMAIEIGLLDWTGLSQLDCQMIDSSDTRASLLGRAIALTDDTCNSPECRALSFMWGGGANSIFVHKNISSEVHGNLKNYFGPVNIRHYKYISKMLKKEFLESNDGFDYENEAESWSTPLLLLSGKENQVFPRSQKKTFDFIKPNNYSICELQEIEGYGHQDVIIGKDFRTDVFPLIKRWLQDQGVLMHPSVSVEAPEGLGGQRDLTNKRSLPLEYNVGEISS